MSVYLYESILSKKVNILLKHKGVKVYSKNISKEKSNEVNAVFVKLQNKIYENEIKKFKNLKYIISPTTGTNHIKVRKNSKLRIINLKSYEISHIKSTCEFTLSLILSAARNIINYALNTKKNDFDRYSFETRDFKNITCGIIGYGRVGKYLEKKLRYLGFKIIVNDIKKIKFRKLNIDNLRNLLKKSDIISLNINYSEENKNFLNYKKLNLCKKKPILINTSRGEVINEKDLIKLIKKNKIKTAYLDVISNEQIRFGKKLKNDELLKMNKANKIHIFPHIAGSSKDSIKEAELIVIKKYLKAISINS